MTFGRSTRRSIAATPAADIQSRGEVIGINTAIYSRTAEARHRLAVPSTLQRQSRSNARTRQISRGWLGVQIQELTRHRGEPGLPASRALSWAVVTPTALVEIGLKQATHSVLQRRGHHSPARTCRACCSVRSRQPRGYRMANARRSVAGDCGSFADNDRVAAQRSSNRAGGSAGLHFLSTDERASARPATWERCAWVCRRAGRQRQPGR